MKPVLLDAYCGAGGATKGYQDAGFYVIGCDINPQPNYIGDEFYQMDAIEFIKKFASRAAAIHSSPPCQAFTSAAFIWRTRAGYDYDGKHPDLVAATRTALIATGKPYVIENVNGAPLVNPMMLCGTMFGLRTFRHRKFESNIFMLAPGHQAHPAGAVTNSFRHYSSFENGATHITVAGHNFRREDGVKAFGNTCEWMTRHELAESIPPCYTEYWGHQLMQYLEAQS